MIRNPLELTFLILLIILGLSVSCKKDDDVQPDNSNSDSTLNPVDTSSTQDSTVINDSLNISDLKVLKSVDIQNPEFGDEVIFTIELINNGPNSARNIIVKDSLPSGYSFIEHYGNENLDYDNNSGLWSVPKLDSLKSIVLNIRAAVNDTGDYLNFAEIIKSENQDPNSIPNNNVISEDDQDSASTRPQLPEPEIIVSTLATVTAFDALAYSPDGHIFASSYGYSKVYKLDTNGNVETFLTAQPGAAGVAFDNSGLMYLARYSSADIVNVNSSGSSVNPFSTGIPNPIALEFDGNGYLYTNNNYNYFITKIDVSGNKSAIPTSLLNNSSLAIDDNNDIYISDYNSGIIKKIDGQSQAESTFCNLPLQSGGVGYVIYHNGFFYASAITDHQIYRIDQNGNYEVLAGIKGNSGFNDGPKQFARFFKPIGLAISEDGKTLYVGQTDKIRVIKGF